MGNLFNVEGPFITFLTKVCDLILLSTLWLLTCIPVITIGPANTALYYATVKVIRRERGYLFREYFRSFRLNFKKAAIIGVITGILYITLGFDVYITWASKATSGNITSIFMGTYIAVLVFLTFFSLYVYPVLSRFDVTFKQLYKISFYLSIKHILRTLGLLAIWVLAAIAVVFNYMFIFIVPAGACLVSSLLMEPVLKKYTPKSENTDDESAKDEWYLE